MKHQKIGIILCGIFLSQSVWAAEDYSGELQQLQQQLTQLQTQVNQEAAVPVLSVTSAPVNNPWVGSDFQNPLGFLSSPTVAYSLLQAQAQYSSILTFGGSFDAAAQMWNGSELSGTVSKNAADHFDHHGSAIAATSADIYILANFTQWAQAFVTVEGGLNGYDTTISEGFVNIGNLQKTPFYATLGQTYLPFGTFPGNGLVASTPETNAFESTQVAQADIGFGQGGFNATLTAFNGSDNLNNFVLSTQYTKTLANWTLSGGAGYMYDIRYSGSGIAAAYNTSNGRTNIRTSTFQNERNGAVNVNGSALYAFHNNQSLEGAAEWMTTTHSPTTVIDNIQPGRLQGWSVAGTYSLPVLHKNTTVTVDYSAVIHMDAVPLQLSGPVNQQAVSVVGVKNQWLTDFQTEVINNVYVGPEFAWINLVSDKHTWETAASVSVYL